MSRNACSVGDVGVAKCRLAGRSRRSIKRLTVGLNLPLSMPPITTRCSNAAMRHSSRLSAVALGNDDQPPISLRGPG
jgi:hypothetical protein